MGKGPDLRIHSVARMARCLSETIVHVVHVWPGSNLLVDKQR